MEHYTRRVRRTVTMMDHGPACGRIKCEAVSPKQHERFEDAGYESGVNFFSFASHTSSLCIQVKQEDVELGAAHSDMESDPFAVGCSSEAWAEACRNVADAATTFASLEASRAEATALAASLAVAKANELATAANIAHQEAMLACQEADAAKQSALEAAEFAVSSEEAAIRAESVASAFYYY